MLLDTLNHFAEVSHTNTSYIRLFFLCRRNLSFRQVNSGGGTCARFVGILGLVEVLLFIAYAFSEVISFTTYEAVRAFAK